MWFTAALFFLLAPDLVQSLLDADRAFDTATAARGLDGWMSFFADDAVINAPGGPVKGKAALREHYLKMFARPEFSIRWKPFHAEVSKDATLGYTLGTAVISYRDEKGQVQRRDGRYLSVWRKAPGGTWKVVTDLGN